MMFRSIYTYFTTYLLPHTSIIDDDVVSIIFNIIATPEEPSKLSFLRFLEDCAFNLKKIFGRVFHFQDYLCITSKVIDLL